MRFYRLVLIPTIIGDEARPVSVRRDANSETRTRCVSDCCVLVLEREHRCWSAVSTQVRPKARQTAVIWLGSVGVSESCCLNPLRSFLPSFEASQVSAETSQKVSDWSTNPALFTRDSPPPELVQAWSWPWFDPDLGSTPCRGSGHRRARLAPWPQTPALLHRPPSPLSSSLLVGVVGDLCYATSVLWNRICAPLLMLLLD